MTSLFLTAFTSEESQVPILRSEESFWKIQACIKPGTFSSNGKRSDHPATTLPCRVPRVRYVLTLRPSAPVWPQYSSPVYMLSFEKDSMVNKFQCIQNRFPWQKQILLVSEASKGKYNPESLNQRLTILSCFSLLLADSLGWIAGAERSALWDWNMMPFLLSTLPLFIQARNKHQVVCSLAFLVAEIEPFSVTLAQDGLASLKILRHNRELNPSHGDRGQTMTCLDWAIRYIRLISVS